MISRVLYGIVAACALAAFSPSAVCAEEAGHPAEAEHPPEAGHGAGGHGHHIGTAGVSEDPAEVKTDLAIYSLVIFLGLLGLLYKFAWGPIAEGLEKREAGILQNISEAEAARMKAEKMLAEHAAKLDKVQDEVRAILAEARSDAEHTKNDIIATAQKEADSTRQRAVQDIERARDQALDDLFDHMAKVVEEATERVVGRSLTSEDHDRLIREALTSVGNRQN